MPAVVRSAAEREFKARFGGWTLVVVGGRYKTSQAYHLSSRLNVRLTKHTWIPCQVAQGITRVYSLLKEGVSEVMILIFTKSNCHSLSNTVRTLARKRNIPWVATDSLNPGMVARHFLAKDSAGASG